MSAFCDVLPGLHACAALLNSRRSHHSCRLPYTMGMPAGQRGRSVEPMIQEQTSQSRPNLFHGYDTGGFFDEMFDVGKPRTALCAPAQDD